MRIDILNAISQRELGMVSERDMIDRIKGILGKRSSRCEYIHKNYMYNQVTGRLSHKTTGNEVSNLVYAGPGNSPVVILRAKWFVLVGDDPAQVRYSKGEGVYAIYDKGDGTRVYLDDILKQRGEPEQKRGLIAQKIMAG